MTKKEQREFVKGLIRNIRLYIVAKMNSHDLPKEWDGIELRQFVADEFADGAMPHILKGSRKKEYNNYKLVNGL